MRTIYQDEGFRFISGERLTRLYTPSEPYRRNQTRRRSKDNFAGQATPPLGERIVDPGIDGDDKSALKEAALKPTILESFYRQYNKNKMPKQDTAHSLLKGKGVPSDRVDSVWEIIKANAKATNMLRLIGGSEYIFLDSTETSSSETNQNPSSSSAVESEIDNTDVEGDVSADFLQNVNSPQQQANTTRLTRNNEKLKIFISHGKNSSAILGQLKELLIYGQMEPVISVERERTAIPVPDIELPSNLQGLYRCEYEGDQLDYTSTMKLLKTMQELREKVKT